MLVKDLVLEDISCREGLVFSINMQTVCVCVSCIASQSKSTSASVRLNTMSTDSYMLALAAAASPLLELAKSLPESLEAPGEETVDQPPAEAGDGEHAAREKEQATEEKMTETKTEKVEEAIKKPDRKRVTGKSSEASAPSKKQK